MAARNEHRNGLIMQAYDEGVALAEIARRHDLSPSAIAGIVYRFRAGRPQRTKRRFDRAAVAADRAAGMTLRAIGKKHGVSGMAILLALQKGA